VSSNTTTSTNGSKEPIVLQAGQVWRVSTGFIQIVMLGKTLAHYKHSKTLEQRGTCVSLAQATAVAALIEKGGATLMPATKPAKH
jgi:hypothetical protein